jgi:glycosyltransferase involved in cell wall biosynthesis
MHLSVVIPAYNEAKLIESTLQAVCDHLRRQPYGWEVIVVDNRSTDDTAAIVTKYGEVCPQVRVVSEKRPGKGYAVTAGMLAARGQYRLFMDADHSTTIDHVDRMLPFMDEGYDVVIGSLTVPGSSVRREGREPFWRVIFGKLGNKWIQVFAVWGIGDTQRGFKLFSDRATNDIFPHLTIFGWGFDVEVLAIARANGYRIKEIPVVNWNNAAESRVTIMTYPKVLLSTLVVFWNRVTGKYRT